MGSYAHFLWDAEESGADDGGDISTTAPWIWRKEKFLLELRHFEEFVLDLDYNP